ncbi:MAG: hypothetical protein Q8Q88_12320 [Phenylobacterium sp.]|uniref:hypothetical protein n=1 Tax=Phenylobacterium sp. TaxID=1871053 RepID=UPI0027371C8E|nr:hypothetical protein [Phenylobacterium sp.]MDP3747821.1 hypothetical protein [Phenylobacterium sp.]
MIPQATDAAPEAVERDEDLLTRAEASAFLATLKIRMKPATLARIWSVGGAGPPCIHVRAKPFYPRGSVRDWAEGQITGLRRSARDAPAPRRPAS